MSKKYVNNTPVDRKSITQKLGNKKDHFFNGGLGNFPQKKSCTEKKKNG